MDKAALDAKAQSVTSTATAAAQQYADDLSARAKTSSERAAHYTNLAAQASNHNKDVKALTNQMSGIQNKGIEQIVKDAVKTPHNELDVVIDPIDCAAWGEKANVE